MVLAISRPTALSGRKEKFVFCSTEKAPVPKNGSFCIRIQINYSCFCALIFTPGPMVEAVTQERMYWPFAAAGLALMMAPSRAT